MKIVLDMLVALCILSSIFANYVHELGCLQVNIILFTLFLIAPWLASSAIIETLQNPFAGSCHQDSLNPGALGGGAVYLQLAPVRTPTPSPAHPH